MRTIAVSALMLIIVCDNLVAGSVYYKKLNYQVIVQDNPTKVHKFAAKELKKFLSLTYSKPIEINGEKDLVTFYVGFPSEAIIAGFSKLPTISQRFGIFRRNNSFLMLGDDSPGVDPEATDMFKTGTLSAVYYFLTKYAGVKFYLPGDEGYSVSPECPISFKAKQDIPMPTFEVRGIAPRKNNEISLKDFYVYSRRMLCNRPYWSRYEYIYTYVWKWKKRFWKVHPEYFMIRNGKPYVADFPWHVPCFSNPDVVRQTAADIIAVINGSPHIRVVRLFIDGAIERCQCAKCSPPGTNRDFIGKFDNNEAVYGFQKKVIDLVHQAYPDLCFISQTKLESYEQPPTRIKMGSKFTIEIQTMRPVPHADYTASVKLAKAWDKTGVRTILCSYPRYPEFNRMPVINPVFTHNYFKKFVGVVRGAYRTDMTSEDYSFSALNMYIQAKALFDINIDVNNIMADFCSFAYPGACKEMLDYYREMERLFMQVKKIRGDHLVTIYYFDKLAKAKTILDSAAKKVKKDSIWFSRLNSDFNAFYKRSLAAKPRADKLKKSLASLTPVTLPHTNDSAKALKYNFMARDEYKDFQETTATLWNDDEFLHITLIANEPHVKQLKQKCKVNNEGPVWEDDCFEIMLMPNREAGNYYQIIINSIGTYRVIHRQPGKSVNTLKSFLVKTESSIKEKAWQLKVQIPLSQFNDSDFTKTWKFNIFRTRVINKNKGGIQAYGIRLFNRGRFHNTEEYALLNWETCECKPGNSVK